MKVMHTALVMRASYRRLLLPCRLPLLRLEQLPLIDRCVLLHLLAI